MGETRAREGVIREVNRFIITHLVHKAGFGSV